MIGEGGSGGALAIAVGDVILMMQYAIYSVISPEGCASILWRSAEKAPDAAEALGIISSRLKTLGLIDKIVPEPLGGAHRDPQAALQALKKALAETLKQLQEKKPKQLVEERLERLMAYGKFKEARTRARKAPRIAVALSGGVDSVTLLHQLRDRGPVAAIHVHHGLSPNADAWAAFCRKLCKQWDVPLTV